MVRLGSSDLDVFPLCLGGNVFGWTADRDASFAVLDAYVAGGGNFIDSADVYSAWAPGNGGGESETVIGEWMRARGNRARVIVATKVGSHPQLQGTSPRNIRAAVEQSLHRLGTNYIDLYYAHIDDGSTPMAETLGALFELVDAGKVRAVGLSNYKADRLAEAVRLATGMGNRRIAALQPKYNLMERREYEGGLLQVVRNSGIGVVTYSSLASGFLTGKYRAGQDLPDSPRAGGASQYLDERGNRVLAALDQVAAAHGTEPGSVALAWLAAQPTVTAPIASARTVDQVPGLLAAATLKLSPDEIQTLTDASAPAAAGAAV